MSDFKQNYLQRRTKDKGPRSNNRIFSPEVQVIDSDSVTIRRLDNTKQENMKLDKFIKTHSALNMAPSK